MSVTAREAALKALAAYRREGAWPDKSLGGVFERSDMSARDRALAVRIVGGVMQNLMLLDYYIGNFSSVGLKKIEPQVLDILRISIYQLVFMDIPHSAAVNEGVKLAKKRSNPRGAGFVNAMLRKVSDAVQNTALPEVSGKDDIEKLSITYSHPEWLTREFYDILGSGGTEALLKANNDDKTPVTVQVNSLLTSAEKVILSLEAIGIKAVRHEWLEDCINMYGAGGIEELETFKSGHFYVQDAGARISVRVAGIKPGDFVIDGCSAPGGKAFAAAIEMENRGEVAAFDIYENKLRYINDGARRLKLNIIHAREQDATEPVDKFTKKADVVLADVPCSGFGVIRKKPEIRYKKREDIAGLPEVQKRILQTLSSYVKPGGVLLYSTCTVIKSENEEIIDWFLRTDDRFVCEGFTVNGKCRADKGMITLWPHLHGTDGFFICKLRRRI